MASLLRDGAQQLLYAAVEAELAEYLSQYQAERVARGRRYIVRNGYLPDCRKIHVNVSLLSKKGQTTFYRIVVCS